MTTAFEAPGRHTLQRYWLGTTALCVTLLVHFVLYVRDRDASQPLLLLGGSLVILTVVSVTLAAISGSARWLQRLRAAAQPLSPVYFAAGGALLLGFGLVQRPEWLYAHTSLTLVILVVLAGLTLYPDMQARPRKRVILLAVVLGVMAARVYALGVTPPIHSADEGWILSWPLSLMRTGQMSDLLMLGVNGVPTYYLPHYYVLEAGWLQVVGVGLWQARLFSVIIALIMAVLTTLAAKNLYGRRTAFFVAAALLASAVLVIGFRIRHDIGLALALALAIWCYSQTRLHERPVWHLLAGAAAGCGMFAHYHAMVFAPALWVSLYLPEYVAGLRQGRRWPKPGVWWFAAGMAAGFGLVATVQILPDTETFLGNMSPRNASSLKTVINMMRRYFETLAAVSPYEALLIVLAWISAVTSRRAALWTLAVLVLLLHIALAFVTGIRVDYYLVPLTPVYGLIIGVFAARVAHWLQRQSRMAEALALLILLPALGWTLQAPLKYLTSGGPMFPAPPAPAAWVLENVPADETILGENYYFLWLSDYRYVSPELPARMPQAERARYRLDEHRWDPAVWERFDIDVIIIDPGLATYAVLDTLVESDYLDRHGFVEVAEFPTQDDPTVRIYRRRS